MFLNNRYGLKDMTTTNQSFPIGFTYSVGVSTVAQLCEYINTSIVPAVFLSASPWCVSVTTTGSAIGLPAWTGAKNPPTFPFVITAGFNDEFVYIDQGGSGTPETFTMAPGTYTNFSQTIAATNEAVGSTSGERFDTKVTAVVLFEDVIILISNNVGTANNGNVFTSGTNDVTPYLGFPPNPPQPPYPYVFDSGAAPGVDPGSTRGKAVLFLQTTTTSTQTYLRSG
jgi:hypothetical protein